VVERRHVIAALQHPLVTSVDDTRPSTSAEFAGCTTWSTLLCSNSSGCVTLGSADRTIGQNRLSEYTA